MRRILTLLLLAALMIQVLCIAFPIPVTSAESSDWVVTNVYWKSSADTSQVYPGSKNVELTVVTKYQGPSGATDVAACIKLPTGFSISRGASPCSPPYEPNASKVYSSVKFGDVVIFRYRIDISKNVSPTSYVLPIDVSYIVNGTSYSSTIHAYIVVSPYPPLGIRVVDWYWNPTAYPGTSAATLSIVLENMGNSNVVSAHVDIQLASVFKPSEAHVDLGTLNTNARTTISVRNVHVALTAVPNKRYPVVLKINATAETKDGVEYNAKETIRIWVTVSKAPPVNLSIVSYGLNVAKSVGGEKLARIVVEMQVRDFVTIRAIVAKFSILKGAKFYNSSSIGYATLTGSYGYGSIISMQSPEVLIEPHAKEILANLTLTIFGVRNNAEFWVNQSYTLLIPVRRPSINLSVAKVYWSQQVAYPGSSDLTLNIVLRNNDIVDVRNAVATLKLPPGFYPPQIVVSDVSVAHGSQTTLVFRGIDVSKNVSPGLYEAVLMLNGIIAQGNAFFNVSVSLPIFVKVLSPRSHVLELVFARWSEGRFYTTSIGGELLLVLRVSKPITLSNVVAEVHLPPQLMFESGSRAKNFVVGGSYGYGSTMRITVSSIDSATSIPGTVPIVITVKGLAEDHGARFWLEESFVALLSVKKPELNLSLVGTEWSNDRCLRSCVGASLRVILQSRNLDNVRILVVNASILKGAVFISGSRSRVLVVNTNLRFGDIATVTIGPLKVENASRVIVELRMCAVVYMARGEYEACGTFVVKPSTTSVKPLILNFVTTLLGTRYAPILPNQRDLTIRIYLTNIDVYAVSTLVVRPELPPGFELKGVSGTCLGGVASGSTCYLDLVVDTSRNLSVGLHVAKLSLLVVERVGQSLQMASESLEIPLLVQNPLSYGPNIVPITWFWGVNTPRTVYGFEKHVPVTVRIANIGRYGASSVIAMLVPLTKGVEPIVNQVMCANTLAPNAMCSATFYLNLLNVSGSARFKLVVRYEITSYGTLVETSKSFVLRLGVSKFAGGRGIVVVSSGWENSWPVYPGTQNATYTITLANRWPYTVSGINLTLYLPPGFTHRGRNYVTTYVAGPVRSLDTFTASFTVTVGKDVAPGTYRAKLVVSYVVNVGGSQLRWVDVRYVDMLVQSVSSAVQLVEVRWVGSAPEPGTYGAMLRIVFRDNYVPSMSGTTLTIELPRGFTCAVNNRSVATLAPTMVSPLPTASMKLPSQQAALVALLTAQQAGRQPSISAGSFITFLVPINVLVNRPGTYQAKAILSFIDNWGNVRNLSFVVPLTILGSTKIVEVEAQNSVSFENGSATLRLLVENVGSAPMYNTYMYLIPKSPIAIPKNAVLYLGTVPPGKKMSVNVTLVYNPFSIVSMGGAAVQYQSLPIVVSFVFRDALGYVHQFNSSVSVTIKPFIYIAIGSDTSARYEGGSLIVSGTVINYGIVTAHSVWVYACVDGKCSSTFVGDIDEASQAAFRVEVPGVPMTKTVELRITYLDNYGVEHVKVFKLPVKVENVTVTATVTAQQNFVTPAHVAVIAAVAIFLTGVGIAIARYLRRHAARSESSEVV